MPIFATISGTISNTISSVVQLVADAYPQLGRVLDLAGFSFGASDVNDTSPEDNDAVLYSGKGVNLDGTGDYVELPNVGATKSITVLVRSGTSSTLYATDDAGQTEDASVSLTADSTWQEVTLTFTNAISGAIRLGTDGTSSYTGDLADARLYDASSNLLDEFYLNEHTDTAANGLDGLPVVGRNGNIGQYVGCAAVVQEAGDVGGLTPPQVLGLNFNKYSAVTPTPILDPAGAILVSESLNAGIDALGNALTPRTSKTFNADGSGYAIVPDDNSLDMTAEATWVMKGNFYSGVTNETILGKYDTGSKRSWWIYESATDGAVLISISADGVVTTTHTLSGLTDEVGFLVITYNAGTIKTYWKGSLVDTDVSALTSLYVSDIDVGICCRINSGSAVNVTSNPISDVKIYNRELTAEEVATFV